MCVCVCVYGCVCVKVTIDMRVFASHSAPDTDASSCVYVCMCVCVWVCVCEGDDRHASLRLALGARYGRKYDSTRSASVEGRRHCVGAGASLFLQAFICPPYMSALYEGDIV